jgi:glycosyltransferase involved in cell wall biosynthesis
MYFDHAQLSVAFGLRFDHPVTLSGIYFRPSFHYADFEARKLSLAERVQRIRKRQTLALALRNPHLTHLFCLDPYIVPYVEALHPRVAASFLPDGFTPQSPTRTRAETHEQWGIEAHRKVALFFGVIDGRKGIFRVLDAVQRLPETAQAALALVVAGPIAEQEYTAIETDLQAVRERTRVQLVTDTRFIPDAEIQDLIRGADLALVTYQQHIGSSNVLIRAAAEAVPVLGSDYGLVGEQIRRKQLGLAVDATSAEALAAALRTFLDAPGAVPYNAEAARRFAAENTAERYAETLLGTILTAHPGPVRS